MHQKAAMSHGDVPKPQHHWSRETDLSPHFPSCGDMNDSPAEVETFKIGLDGALSILIWLKVSLLTARGWEWVILKVSFNPNYCMILFFSSPLLCCVRKDVPVLRLALSTGKNRTLRNTWYLAAGFLLSWFHWTDDGEEGHPVMPGQHRVPSISGVFSKVYTTDLQDSPEGYSGITALQRGEQQI